MIKEVVKIAFLLAAGMMVYDINKAGAFTNTDAYKFLKENGVVDFAEVCLGHLKAFFYALVNLITLDPEHQLMFQDSCINAHAYLEVFNKLILVCKNSILALFENSSQSFNKTFPTAVDDVSVVLSGALTSTKEGLVMISSHVQNLTLLAVNYANEMLRT